MRNATNRHVKTNIKNRVKQNTRQTIRDADCSLFCIYQQSGYFSDTVYCAGHGGDVRKTKTCDKFERRE